nr:unnamed protein product [Digitaria exilis]
MAAAAEGAARSPEVVSIPATPQGQSTPEGAETPTVGGGARGKGGSGTPGRRVVEGLRGYLEEVGHLTRLDPRDAWLPVTESRGGNARYAAFHTLNAGLGFQALLLPLAFAGLGWSWGIISLTIAYFWQLYTLWILVKLHEAVPGRRYNRYVELAQAAFGNNAVDFQTSSKRANVARDQSRLPSDCNMPPGGMLAALYAFHSNDKPRGVLAMTCLLVVLNCLSSFQIYSMPVFDSFEAYYTGRTNRPCSPWVRSGFRVFYGFLSLFISVALPFLSSLAGLLGGLTLPVTFAYPCFMWIRVKKPERLSFSWYLNWGLGLLGTAFSLAFSLGGVWSIVNNGMKFKFFKPAN